MAASERTLAESLLETGQPGWRPGRIQLRRRGGVYVRPTGWIHYGARYFSTITGTFTQQDTIDAPLDPANGNRYAYVGGDLINNVDPTGLDYADDLLKYGSIGAVYGTGGASFAGPEAAPIGLGVGTLAGGLYATKLQADKVTLSLGAKLRKKFG